MRKRKRNGIEKEGGCEDMRQGIQEKSKEMEAGKKGEFNWLHGRQCMVSCVRYNYSN